jgi:hypothetical protein
MDMVACLRYSGLDNVISISRSLLKTVKIRLGCRY